MAKTDAFDIASANVGDAVVLTDGRTVIINGICISVDAGNFILIGESEWLDASLVASVSV